MIDLLGRNRDLRLLFIAQVVSYLGDWFATVALLGAVHDLTGSALVTSLVWVSQSLPAFLVTPIAGPSADRYDRRRLMVLVSGGQAVAASCFLLLQPTGLAAIGLGAQAAITALGAFFAPASQAAMPNLVEPADLGKAAALFGSTWGAMLAIGAGVGGVFTATFGRPAAFVADAASFVIAGALVAMIRRPTNQAGTHATRAPMRPIADTVEGLRVARRDPVLVALLSSKASFGIGAGAVSVLAVLATTAFHGGDGTTGLLLGARGVGALLGPILARRIVGDDLGKVLTLCGAAMVTYGLSYAVVGMAPSLALAAAFVTVAHLGGGAQWMLSTFGLQKEAPDAVRGRILAADFALVTLSLSVSSTLAGWLAGHLGVRPVMVGLATIAVAIGSTWLLVTRRLRASLGAGSSTMSVAR